VIGAALGDTRREGAHGAPGRNPVRRRRGCAAMTGTFVTPALIDMPRQADG
jgi:hypothetical protein